MASDNAIIETAIKREIEARVAAALAKEIAGVNERVAKIVAEQVGAIVLSVTRHVEMTTRRDEIVIIVKNEVR